MIPISVDTQGYAFADDSDGSETEISDSELETEVFGSDEFETEISDSELETEVSDSDEFETDLSSGTESSQSEETYSESETVDVTGLTIAEEFGPEWDYPKNDLDIPATKDERLKYYYETLTRHEIDLFKDFDVSRIPKLDFENLAISETKLPYYMIWEWLDPVDILRYFLALSNDQSTEYFQRVRAKGWYNERKQVANTQEYSKKANKLIEKACKTRPKKDVCGVNDYHDLDDNFKLCWSIFGTKPDPSQFMSFARRCSLVKEIEEPTNILQMAFKTFKKRRGEWTTREIGDDMIELGNKEEFEISKEEYNSLKDLINEVGGERFCGMHDLRVATWENGNEFECKCESLDSNVQIARWCDRSESRAYQTITKDRGETAYELEFCDTKDAYILKMTHGQDYNITIYFYDDVENKKMAMSILMSGQEEDGDDINNEKAKRILQGLINKFNANPYPILTTKCIHALSEIKTMHDEDIMNDVEYLIPNFFSSIN